MQGYILLKKSQAAWDERDGLRMLTLGQAAHDGPWQLPPLVQAEVAQQEARGLAMTGDPALLLTPSSMKPGRYSLVPKRQ